MRQASQQRRAVLVLVDDDAAVGDALKFSLDLEGFEVRAYADGEELLKAGMPKDACCLVLDFNLPEMDGLELLSRLRALKVALPAILITTHPNPQLRGRARDLGIPIVEKPLLCDTLLDTIRREA
jgi:FixJ family two-component response regulator